MCIHKIGNRTIFSEMHAANKMHCLFQGGYIKHEKTGLCLDLDVEGPIMRTCAAGVITQIWQFNTYVEESSALSKAR